ncbi:hypothetical protein AVDCRST_MAG81-2934 [uncultured Synechococcales cyanobacterium]|uniref:Uncharacterized protein n=1 Tax=uncultured Synechococcales cyanobacterium TaxID=1936017 RepID=A0A6J4VCN8_9CYAN|nr:hypothetical protein AVDCRST_MAG81-2934 [uncultured Synechococcales cyanobacterium]
MAQLIEVGDPYNSSSKGIYLHEADAPEALKALEKHLYYLTACETEQYCFKSIAVPKVQIG